MAARKPVIDLGAAIGAELGAEHDKPAPVQPPAGQPEVGREQRPRRAARPRQEEEAPRTPAWDARMSLTLSKEMKRALDVARVDDGVEGTVRIRAMITLWQEDERLRRRIDKLAKTLRDRDGRPGMKPR